MGTGIRKGCRVVALGELMRRKGDISWRRHLLDLGSSMSPQNLAIVLGGALE